MSVSAWIVAVTVIGAMALFVSERLRFDVIGLIVLVLLMTLGILTPAEGLSGFSNEATVVVAAMFALNAGVVGTGGLDPLIRVLARIRRPWLLTFAVLMIVCPLGAFVKNTALVATFLPVVLGVCARSNMSPARVLMPMSFAAQMGGVCTLLGTSSNLLTNSIAIDHGLPGFSVFEFARLGVPLALVGIVYLMLVGRWLLPRHIDVDFAETSALGKFVTEFRVLPGSPLIGHAIGTADLPEKYGVQVLELLRGDEHVWAPRDEQLRVDDVLIARGDWQRLEDFKQAQKLEIPAVVDAGEGAGARRVLIEAMVAPGARMVGDTVDRIDFPWNFKSTVLAVQRRGGILRESLRATRLQVGIESQGAGVIRRIGGVESFPDTDGTCHSRVSLLRLPDLLEGGRHFCQCFGHVAMVEPQAPFPNRKGTLQQGKGLTRQTLFAVCAGHVRQGNGDKWMIWANALANSDNT